MNFLPSVVAIVFVDSMSANVKPVIAYRPEYVNVVHQLNVTLGA